MARFVTYLRSLYKYLISLPPQGAIFHGLATLLSQPSPVPSRGGPNPAQQPQPTNGGKPKSVSYGMLPDNNPNNQPTYQNNPAFPMDSAPQRHPAPFGMR